RAPRTPGLGPGGRPGVPGGQRPIQPLCRAATVAADDAAEPQEQAHDDDEPERVEHEVHGTLPTAAAWRPAMILPHASGIETAPPRQRLVFKQAYLPSRS